VSVTFYELLGIDPAAPDRHTAAAALWPNDLINATEGFNVSDDSQNIVMWLQAATEFDRVRPGADPGVSLGAGAAGQITIAADLHVTPVAIPAPTLYVRSLPNVGIQLLPTGTENPATVFAAADGRGHEVVVEGLPVELRLPPGLITPAEDGTPPLGAAPEFDADAQDSVGVGVDIDGHPTTIRTHVRMHMTPERDVILEPQVPVSIGGSKLSGFPVEAIHDLLLIPSPNRRDYLEWTRNEIGAFVNDPPAAGAVGFRSIMLDFSKDPLKELAERFRDRSGVHSADVEVILEDLVFPASGLVPFPIPSHATVGLRRKIVDRTSVAEAFSLQDAPFRLKLHPHDDTASGLFLFIDELLFKSGTSHPSNADDAPVVNLQAGIVWEGDKGSTVGGTVGIADDWTVQLGLMLGEQSPLKFEIASTIVSLHTLKGGLSLRRLGDGRDCWQVLGDLSIKSDPGPGGGGSSGHKPFKVTTLTGKPLDLIVRDVGWSFGHMQLGSSIAAPDGVQLIFAQVVRLIVEEMGWVEDPGGGTYFSFSGGVAIGFGSGDDLPPNGERKEHMDDNVGVRFRRLRFLTSDTPAAPPFKLDGIYLNLKYGPVGITGFGYVTDEVDGGFRYEEFGFGVKAELPLLAVTVSLAAEFLKGARHSLANPEDGFDYFLASLQVGYIPAGPVGLYAVRLLIAYNMQPAISPPGEEGQSMVVYQWHKDHDGAIDMPRTRNLADWKPVDHSFAVGVGAGFSLNALGDAFHLGAFILVAHDEEDTLILVVADLYLLKCEEPVAFVAIEYDVAKAKFGLMAGLDLTIDKFVGKNVVPHWMSDIARLSGTLYFGNEPWSVAVGQLADQRTWFGVSINVSWLSLKLRLAVGLQFTDGGPKGFGVVFEFSGGANWGIGAFIVYGGLGFVIGSWKTGSDSSGIHAWAQIGFKIHVFFVFHFGADIGVDVTYLGKHPWYTTLSALVHIDTPWFLPDVTFRFEKTWSEPLPFDTSTIVQALGAGSAASPVAPGNDSHAGLFVPPLADGNGDPKRLYTFNELQATGGAPLQDVHQREDLPIVAVDADVVVEFTNPLANDAAIATDTYTASGGDAGVQRVQDLTARYALKSVSIKRSPRFGPSAGTWTDLVADADTQLDLSGGGSVHATPAVSFRWDADQRADGVLAPKRLLINSRTPYSIVVGSQRNDEEASTNDAGFPCCKPGRPPQPRRHSLSFEAIGAGWRLPASQRFSNEGEWWHWTPVPPVTCAGRGSAAGGHTIGLFEARAATIGSVDFASPAFDMTVELDCSLLDGRVVAEGYHGLQLIDSRTIDATSSPMTAVLRATLSNGFTRVLLRCDPTSRGRQAAPGVEIIGLSYRTCADLAASVGRLQRCPGADQVAATVGGGGKLAFLPNHDYAVTATVEIAVGHKTAATRTLTLSQPAYFRTKGLVGLNAAPNAGDELRPYIASTYPAGGSFPLYREEPVAVAFTENMSNLLPVDRVPAAGDPPEKTQLMELELGVDKLSSPDGPQRLTVPSDDWIDAHDGVIVVGGAHKLPHTAGALAMKVVRKAPSSDARVKRFERLLDAHDCQHDPIHSSQVLLHQPIGPDGAPGPWEPQARMRATVRAKRAPHAERRRFQLIDTAAFTPLADAGTAPDWGYDAGCIVGRAAGTRSYATFGEATWNYLRISTHVDPAGAMSGLAVSVSGSTPVQQAVLALVDQGQLVLIRRHATDDHELGRATLPNLPDGVDLHVTAFDDRVRAQVGDVIVEGDRSSVREGRVALVTNGEARFSSVQVDGLDLYYANYDTSRYVSFAEHIGSHDPTIATIAGDAMGAPPALTAAGVLATDTAEIAAAMSVTADPQARQALFAATTSALGLPALARCERLTVTRLTSSAGTDALLLESPEPLSIIHDIALTLVHRTWHRVPWWHDDVALDPALSAALGRVQRDRSGLVLPKSAATSLAAADADRIVHVRDDASDTIDVYLLNRATAATTLESTLDLATARRAGLADVATKPAGTIAAIRPDGSLAGVTIAPWLGVSWMHQDDPVPITVLANGDETAELVLPATPLVGGTYILDFKLDRERWHTTIADPLARYHAEATIQMTW
jgi:hypothetical protein